MGIIKDFARSTVDTKNVSGMIIAWFFIASVIFTLLLIVSVATDLSGVTSIWASDSDCTPLTTGKSVVVTCD